MAASNVWDYLTKPGEVGLRIYPTSWIPLRPQGEAVPTIPIRAGEYVSTMTIALSMPSWVLPLIPVLLICHIFLDVHTPTDAASAKI